MDGLQPNHDTRVPLLSNAVALFDQAAVVATLRLQSMAKKS